MRHKDRETASKDLQRVFQCRASGRGRVCVRALRSDLSLEVRLGHLAHDFVQRRERSLAVELPFAERRRGCLRIGRRLVHRGVMLGEELVRLLVRIESELRSDEADWNLQIAAQVDVSLEICQRRCVFVFPRLSLREQPLLYRLTPCTW